jgi:RND family efflux transporter MFP subunit
MFPVMERDLSKLSIDPAARERPPRGRGPVVVAIFASAAIVVVALAVFFGKRPAEIRVTSAREAGSSQTAVLNASGYVTPRRRATVSAKVTGKIKDVLIDEGMRVEAGQILARLDDTDALAALRAAESGHAVAKAALEDLKVRLANARRTLERNRELRARELVSVEAFDNAETSVASYEAQLALAEEQVTAAQRATEISRQNVDNCIVRAPFAGIIVSKDAQPGEMVSPISAGGGFTRTGIATIVDMRSLEIEVDVNESYIARVASGQGVEAVLDAYPDWRIPSKVRTVIPTADRQKATVKVRITFNELDPRILPDMGVKVSFLEGARDTASAAVILVPRDAVRPEGDKSIVFVLKGDRVERRAVHVGRERGPDMEITAGLRSGDQVVTWAKGELRDGARAKLEK